MAYTKPVNTAQNGVKGRWKMPNELTGTMGDRKPIDARSQIARPSHAHIQSNTYMHTHIHTHTHTYPHSHTLPACSRTRSNPRCLAGCRYWPCSFPLHLTMPRLSGKAWEWMGGQGQMQGHGQEPVPGSVCSDIVNRALSVLSLNSSLNENFGSLHFFFFLLPSFCF